ncbi:MAG: RNA-binding transcriptional accessory protein [Candidatus Hydrogenedentes bacterium]|nr:RNA-binding transcriptional accessory protein [Candidatus Hydrogenedentota bacterium]
MIESKFVDLISAAVGAAPAQVAVAIELFDKGATIPFVARYRKDVTGNLDEVKLETIEALNNQYTAFTNRRDAILENIEKQGKLSDDLRKQIQECTDATVLEDLYLPYKKARKTKATTAREQGLEPLADFIWAQVAGERSLEEEAVAYVQPEKGVPDAAAALQGAQHIIAERISIDAALRGFVRQHFHDEGVLRSASTKNAEGQKTKFEAYYDYNEPIKKIPSHRLLAVLRGARMGFLRMELAVGEDTVLNEMRARFIQDPASPFAAFLGTAIEDAYRRLIQPAIENEVIQEARKVADQSATAVFRENAENLLLAPPAGQKPVLGVDPGLRTGSKLAVIDAQGAYHESATIYPTEPANDVAGATETLLTLINKHHIQLIAIGNGTGSKEIGRFIKTVIKDNNLAGITTVLVNEAGASIYSASPVAREEFPDLDLTIRGAISIARRLQDPLAELVKLEPRHVGVGQYQHDVNQKHLREGLTKTVEFCVNRVGVDLNTASAELLRYISGIQQNTAKNIVEFRQKNGPFTNRAQLLDVSGVGERTYEQCAGFLRIQNGAEPLDQTSIHPEAYGIVEAIAQSLSVSKSDLIRNRELLEKANLEIFATDTIGKLSLDDIKRELLKPGRDPRKRFQAPQFLEGVDDVKDLEPGMVSEGVVTNVTDFGAFVDIGVHQDGLVHLSELANRYIHDPHEVVKVGDIVQVKVLSADKDRGRVSLSIKALLPPPRHRHRSRNETDQPDAAGGQAERRPERETGSQPRPAKAAERSPSERSREGEPARGQRSEDSNRPRGRRTEKKGGGRKRNAGDKAAPAKHDSAPSEPMNTLLADQLAALREKFGGN